MNSFAGFSHSFTVPENPSFIVHIFKGLFYILLFKCYELIKGYILLKKVGQKLK